MTLEESYSKYLAMSGNHNSLFYRKEVLDSLNEFNNVQASLMSGSGGSSHG